MTITDENTNNSATMNNTNSSLLANESQVPRRYIAIIALVQGLILAYLYQSVEHNIWPGSDLPWLTALVTFFVSFPSLFLLIASRHDCVGIFKSLLPFTLLISLLGAYIGSQHSAFPNIESTFFVFTLAILIACFKAIMYIKLLANKHTINYGSLFLASWRNAVIFSVSILFMMIFFGILHLGAALFDLVGIAFFTELLRKEWFWIPAVTLAAAFAIHIFRKISYLADNISTILQTLMKFLLPLLVFVSLGFLATLPFTGLDKLWETRSGSFLLLWLMALSLFFVNAIYHKGNGNKPYPIILHRFILVGVATLPIFSIIAAHGIIARIGQYGFTPDRLWALSVWFILSCFALGYLIGIIKHRDNWLLTQSKVNVLMGLVLLAFVLLVNSPILNFKAISSSSQMARYYAGEVPLDDLDIYYFSNILGKPGYLAMQKLKEEIAESNPEVAARIDTQYEYLKTRSDKRNRRGNELERPHLTVIYWPSEDAFNKELIVHLDKEENKARWAHKEYRLSIDLNEDGVYEWITIHDQTGYYNASLWTKTESDWESRGIQVKVPRNKDLAYSLDHIEMKLVEPKYKVAEFEGITIDIND